MKALNIQIQPGRVMTMNEPEILSLLKDFGEESRDVEDVEIEEGEDGGRYINIIFYTTNIKKLWARIQRKFYAHKIYGPQLDVSSIVLCQGDYGWDDSLLLHHFDKTQQLDTVN